MLPIKKRRRLVVLLSLVATMAFGVDAVTRHLTAKEAPQPNVPAKEFRDAAVVSDLSAEEMAREILVLQEKLGGSIVPALAPTPPESPRWIDQDNAFGVGPSQPLGNALITDQEVRESRHEHWPTEHSQAELQRRKIQVLRESAFNLDRMAHELEQLDLYEEADRLREVGGQLRRNARERKQQFEAEAKAKSPGLSAQGPARGR